MFVYWGKKVSRHGLGWVGDFCPICLSVECMRVVQLRTVGHLYGVPLGKGTPFARELTCRGCASTFGAAEIAYTKFAAHPGADGPSLAAETSPDVLEDIADRFEVEDRIVAGTLSEDDRLHIIAEPMVALEYMTTQRLGRGRIPTGAGLAIIALVFTIPAAAISWASPGTPPAFLAASTALVPLLIAASVMGYVRGHRAWVRTILLPRLAPLLQRMDPSPEELRAVLHGLAEQGYLIGKRIRPEALAAAIKARQPQSADAAF